MDEMNPSNGRSREARQIEERAGGARLPGAPKGLPERVDGEALRARVDAMAAEARRIDEALRRRIGRWHSACVDCSD